MRFSAAGLAGVAWLFAAQPAAAAYLLIEAEGTAVGRDFYNALGGGVVNFALPFSLVGTVDLAGLDPGDPTYVEGGSLVSPGSPAITDAHVEVGPFTLNMPGNALGTAYVSPTRFNFTSSYLSSLTQMGIDVAFTTPLSTADLRSLPTGNLCAVAACSGGAIMGACRLDTAFQPSSVRVTYFAGDPPDVPYGAVPEPSAWALLILGLGLTGGTLRRRQGALQRAGTA